MTYVPSCCRVQCGCSSNSLRCRCRLRIAAQGHERPVVDSSASIRPIPRASRQLDAGQPRDGLAFGQCNEPACAVPCVREKRRQTGGKDFFPLLSALGPFLGDQANWPPLSEPLLFFCELSQLVCEHCRPFLEVRRRRGLAGWRLRTRMRSVVLGRWRLQGKGGCVWAMLLLLFFIFFARSDVTFCRPPTGPL